MNDNVNRDDRIDCLIVLRYHIITTINYTTKVNLNITKYPI